MGYTVDEWDNIIRPHIEAVCDPKSSTGSFISPIGNLPPKPPVITLQKVQGYCCYLILMNELIYKNAKRAAGKGTLTHHECTIVLGELADLKKNNHCG